MKKRKKQWSACTPQYETCNSNTVNTGSQGCDVCGEKPMNCKPTPKNKVCKKPKKDIECEIEECEITCVDKCADLAKKAEKLFEKALNCDCQAVEAYEKAEELEQKAKNLSAKASKLQKNANCSEGASKEAECKAKQLMEKAEKLAEQAKCLLKEAKCVESEANESCEEAKDLYEKSQKFNEKAKELYNQAMKYDEKALKCYKSAGEKVKEYELKSKKCQEMISKCGDKLTSCDKKPESCNKKPEPCKKPESCCKKPEKNECNMCKHPLPCQSVNSCEKPKKCPTYVSCGSKQNCNDVKEESFEEEIIYIEDFETCTGDLCSTYVSPVYDMAPMQFAGDFVEEYPSLEMPYMNAYINQYQDMNDMWMSYYAYLQNIMMQNMFNTNRMQ